MRWKNNIYKKMKREKDSVCVCVCVYIYIYWVLGLLTN